MERDFGDTYWEYKRRVPRWIPWPPPKPPNLTS
jgi:protein-S-isoprenylcysteine O-methyltransferase Ste14